MKLRMILIFALFTTFYCKKKEQGYFLKLKKCEEIISPCDVLYQKRIVGEAIIHSMDDTGCKGELLVNDSFKIKSSMDIFYRPVFIGEPYLEIVTDSSRIRSERILTKIDSIICN